MPKPSYLMTDNLLKETLKNNFKKCISKVYSNIKSELCLSKNENILEVITNSSLVSRFFKPLEYNFQCIDISLLNKNQSLINLNNLSDPDNYFYNKNYDIIFISINIQNINIPNFFTKVNSILKSKGKLIVLERYHILDNFHQQEKTIDFVKKLNSLYSLPTNYFTEKKDIKTICFPEEVYKLNNFFIQEFTTNHTAESYCDYLNSTTMYQEMSTDVQKKVVSFCYDTILNDMDNVYHKTYALSVSILEKK